MVTRVRGGVITKTLPGELVPIKCVIDMQYKDNEKIFIHIRMPRPRVEDGRSSKYNPVTYFPEHAH